MSSSSLLEMKQKILADIVKVSAFQETGASTIPYSFDLMKLAGAPQTLKQTTKAYQLLFRSENLHQVRRIAGVSPAGEAFAALLSYLEKKPLLWLSSMETTPHRRITGLLQPGDSVLLVDGIQASSLGEAAGIVRAEGGLVSDALVLISDSHTGAKLERSLKVHSLLSVSEIIDYVASKGNLQ